MDRVQGAASRSQNDRRISTRFTRSGEAGRTNIRRVHHKPAGARAGARRNKVALGILQLRIFRDAVKFGSGGDERKCNAMQCKRECRGMWSEKGSWSCETRGAHDCVDAVAVALPHRAEPRLAWDRGTQESGDRDARGIVEK